MSKSSTATAQKSHSQLSQQSAWARGPPSSTSTPRSQSPAPPNVSSAPYPTHSRRASNLGPNAYIKDAVSMPRNNSVGPAKSGPVVAFGSVDDDSTQVSTIPATQPPVARSDVPRTSGPAPTAPSGQVNGRPSVSRQSSIASTTTNAPATSPSPSATPPSGSKSMNKFDVKKLFQNPSSSDPNPLPAVASPSARPAPLPQQQLPPQSSPQLPQGPPPPSQQPPMSFTSFGPAGDMRPQQQNGPGMALGSGTRSPVYQRPIANGAGARPSSGPGGPAPQPPMSAGMSSPRIAPNHPGQMPPTPQGVSMSWAPWFPDPYVQYQWYSQQPHVMPPPQQQQQIHPQYQLPSAQLGPPHSGIPMSPRHPPIQLQQPGTPIQTHPVPSSVHPIPPPLGPSSSVNSMSPPPTTPSTMGSTLSQPAPRLSTNAPAFVPGRSKVTIKSAVDGQELNIETLKHTHTQSGTPAAPAATATTSRRVSVRIESEDVKKQRLDQEKAEEKARREKEERAKKEKEDAERKKREAEEAERERLRKEEEEKERLRKEDEERERKKKEEEENTRLRKEAEERQRLEDEERKRKEEAEAEEKERLRREVEKAEAERERLRKEDEERAVASAAAAQAEGESTPTVPEEAEEGEIVDTPPLQLRIDTTVPIKSPTLDGLKKRPDPLDLSHSHRPIPAPLPSALATAKVIDDLGRVPYPEGILSPKVELNVNAKDGKFRYDRDFLLQFMSICKEKPDMLPPLDAIGLEPVDQTYSMARGGSGRHRQSSNPPPSSSSRPAVGLGISGSSSGAFGKPAPFNMAMGNFSTMPTKLSSDERFAMSNGARVASGPAGMQFGRAPPMVRSSSQGGPGGSGPGSGSHRTRSKRGEKRNESNRVGSGLPGHGPGFGGMGSTGGFHDLEPLAHSGNRWVPNSVSRKPVAVDPDSPEVVDRKVRSLLNKLTMEKFDSISSQIVEWANKSEKEKNGRTLIQVIRLVFEKATDEATWSEMYARLCRKMMEQISPNVQDDGIKNAEGKPIAGGQLFRKYLLNRCQEDFERGWVAKEATAAAAATKAIEDQAAAKHAIDKGEEIVLYSEEYYAAQKAKRQGLGLIKFIGELFKLQMLTERIMHECIKKLLGNVDDPEEEEIESLCKLLATVGAILDTNKARAHMDVYFSRMRESVKSPNVSSRMQFMLQDVIELRERRWVSRNAVAAPSTIAQVHEAAAKEKAAQEKEAHQRQMTMSRGGSRRGGERSSETAQPGADGWAVAGNGPSRPPPKAGDLSNFGKIAKSTPTSFTPSGVFTGKKDSVKKEPSSLSRTSSSSNMFSMLSQNADGTVVEGGASKHAYAGRKGSVDITQSLSEPQQRKKLVLQPRSKPVEEPIATAAAPPSSDSSSDEEPPQLPLAPSMSEAEAAKKIAEDIKEFFSIRNLDEAEEYFTSLPIEHRFRLVDKLVTTAIESKETDAQLVADFFARATEKELCGPTIFEEGFTPTAEILDDLKYDVPKAFELMAIMMKGAGLDKDEGQSKRIASKSTDSNKLLALLSS